MMKSKAGAIPIKSSANFRRFPIGSELDADKEQETNVSKGQHGQCGWDPRGLTSVTKSSVITGTA